jgi:hypothetical protein
MIIENQALLRSYDSAPRPRTLAPTSPLSPVQRLSLRVCCQSNLLTGEGEEEVGEEPNHMTVRKPGTLINHSRLSEFSGWCHLLRRDLDKYQKQLIFSSLS